MPQEITKGKLKSYIEDEGFWYCLEGYIDPAHIVDEELREKCLRLVALGREIQKDLEDVEADWT